MKIPSCFLSRSPIQARVENNRVDNQQDSVATRKQSNSAGHVSRLDNAARSLPIDNVTQLPASIAIRLGEAAAGFHIVSVAADHSVRRLGAFLKAGWESINRGQSTDKNKVPIRKTPLPGQNVKAALSGGRLQTFEQGITSIRTMGSWNNHMGDLVPVIYSRFSACPIWIHHPNHLERDVFVPGCQEFGDALPNQRLILQRILIANRGHYQPMLVQEDGQLDIAETTNEGNCFWESVLMAARNSREPISSNEVHMLRNEVANYVEENRAHYWHFFAI